ncbi:serine hydrolase family protein [Candidatus Woesearchaeota archaeon]|nr:serine hydrolase family protein [Candidatus Woesearchaeota archaeon]
MTNVIIAHGLEGNPQENWYPWLKTELEKLGCKVTVPQFPNPDRPCLEDWLAHPEIDKELLTLDTILVGHSLGGTFFLKFLERYGINVKAIYLVASQIGELPVTTPEVVLPFIGKGFNWEKIRRYAGKVYSFYSDNDPIASYKNAERLVRELGAELTTVKGAGHFNQASSYTQFPLLLEKISAEINRR